MNFNSVGLDPAQPYFQEYEPDVRLDPSDAMFVDVIHTDAEPLLAGGEFNIENETSGFPVLDPIFIFRQSNWARNTRAFRAC